MIGTLPISALAPPEYGLALDAAMTLLGPHPAVVCGEPALAGEVHQRLPHGAGATARAGLWVEPDRRSWRAELAQFTQLLAPGAPLVLVVSLPLARLLPQRRGWSGQPLGQWPGGLLRLRAALRKAGFAPTALHGFHGPRSIALGLLAGWHERRGRNDLADRLGFAARLHYRSSGPLAQFATVALLICRTATT